MLKSKHALITLAAAVLLIGSVVISGVIVNEFYRNNVPTSCRQFEGNYIWLPQEVSDVFLNKIVVLHFSVITGDEITMNGIVRDGAIVSLECDKPAEYDFEIWMSDVNALQLATSQKPITTFVTLKRTGQITVVANGLENEKLLAYEEQLLAKDSEPVPDRIRETFERFLDQD